MAIDSKRRIGELENELKRRDERIEDLRAEIDEQRDLINRLRQTSRTSTARSVA